MSHASRVQTIEVLENFLGAYGGVLMVVSHDRAFMDNTCDQLFVLEGDGVVRGFGNSYTEYLQMLDERTKAAAAAARLAASPAGKVNTRLSRVNTHLSRVNTRLSRVNTRLSRVNTHPCQQLSSGVRNCSVDNRLAAKKRR